MRRITIIEDDIALNNGIALALKNDDYHFKQCYKLSEFQQNEPTDLILLDINMPDGNGFSFLKELRQTSDIPVIILTANDLETDEVTGLNLGADAYAGLSDGPDLDGRRGLCGRECVVGHG